MTNDSKLIDFEGRIDDDIYDFLLSMDEEEMKEFLAEAGLNLPEISESHQRAVEVATRQCGKALLDAAKSQLNERKAVREISNVVSLPLRKKHEIRDALLSSANEKVMTMAARNQSSEEDIDALIEAAMLLGILNENGDLK